MLNFLAHAWWLILVLGILITFHEYGHYLAARRMGVKVLTFSVGFGRALFKRTGKNGTDFVVAALPLGGYVKMLDEREAPVARHELDQTFNRASLGARSIIVAAGPVFNLIFAVLAFWLMFLIGVQEPKTILAETTGLAQEAGLQAGDRVVAVDGRAAETWTHVLLGMIAPALDKETVTLEVEKPGGLQEQYQLDFAGIPGRIDEQRLLTQAGLNPWNINDVYTDRLTNELGELSEDLPAVQAGLQSGDRIVQIAGQNVTDWNGITTAIDRHAAAGEPMLITYQRAGVSRDTELTPVLSENGNPIIGIRPVPLPEEQLEELRALQEQNVFIWRRGPITAISASFAEMWQFTTGTLGILGRMVTGKASLDNLSGPITIASLSKQSAERGLSTFLRLLALISLSLAILNLLPIPMLDGGQLLYFLIEWLTGKPVSENFQMVGQGIGVLMLVCLMSLAFYNDIARLVS